MYRTKKHRKLVKRYHAVIIALCVSSIVAGCVFAVNPNLTKEHAFIYHQFQIANKFIALYSLLVLFKMIRDYLLFRKNVKYTHAGLSATMAIKTDDGVDLSDQRVQFDIHHNMEDTDTLNEIVAVYLHHMAETSQTDKISSDNLCEFINYGTHYLASTDEEVLKVAMRAQFVKNSFFR